VSNCAMACIVTAGPCLMQRAAESPFSILEETFEMRIKL
jgi:hypothetical protein